MLLSIALILLLGMFMGWLCKKIHLPGLTGMLLTGILLGPYVLNLIDSSLLNISSDLRRIALIIILARAGLSLDLKDLKKVGRPAVLMCFVPACLEMLGMVLLAPALLGISVLDAAIMGCCGGCSLSRCSGSENAEAYGGRIRGVSQHSSVNSCRRIGG